MTNEERKLALYCLKAGSDYHSEVCEECIKYPNCDHTGQDDVTETIIKALEQELCKDAISRDAALSVISCHFLLEDDKDKTEYEFAYEDGIKTAYEDVERLPPVQPKQLYDSCGTIKEQLQKTGHWIPVSKKTPNPNQRIDNVDKYYLVQNEYGDMMVASWDGKGWEQMYQHSYIEDEIVAWKPLPKPYKAESEEMR